MQTEKQRKRLVELINNSGVSFCNFAVGNYEEEAKTKLADYLISNNVVVLPCKVGDMVYYPSFNVGMVFSYKVVSIKLNSKGWYIVLDSRLRNEQMTHKATQIGKTIFLKMEEAENMLKERKENGK